MNLLLVDLEEGTHELEVGEEQLVPEFKVADVVTITQTDQLIDHRLGFVLAQEFLLDLPAIEQWGVAAIGAAIGAPTPCHHGQYDLFLRPEDRSVNIGEFAVLREDVVVREWQRGQITDLMRIGPEDLAIFQTLPHAIDGAIFAATQKLHEIANGILAVAHADEIHVRVLDSLLLREHGLITTDTDRQFRLQRLEHLKIGLHGVPVRAHHGEGNQIRLQRHDAAGIVLRAISFGIPQDQNRLENDLNPGEVTLQVSRHAGQRHGDFVAIRRVKTEDQTQFLSCRLTKPARLRLRIHRAV